MPIALTDEQLALAEAVAKLSARHCDTDADPGPAGRLRGRPPPGRLVGVRRPGPARPAPAAVPRRRRGRAGRAGHAGRGDGGPAGARAAAADGADQHDHRPLRVTGDPRRAAARVRRGRDRGHRDDVRRPHGHRDRRLPDGHRVERSDPRRRRRGHAGPRRPRRGRHRTLVRPAPGPAGRGRGDRAARRRPHPGHRPGAAGRPARARRPLAAADPAALRAVVAALLAAEASGLARWCQRTGLEYVKVREQFGRTIGEFQAIKHKCARLFVRAELIVGRRLGRRGGRRPTSRSSSGWRRRPRPWSARPARSTSPWRRSRCSAASATPGSTTSTCTGGGRWRCSRSRARGPSGSSNSAAWPRPSSASTRWSLTVSRPASRRGRGAAVARRPRWRTPADGHSWPSEGWSRRATRAPTAWTRAPCSRSWSPRNSPGWG